MPRLVFITGGVVSSLGKGIASASLGALLQARGYKVRLRKLDPYLNIDPGTMSPFQHGEVFVTEDGAETDLDLGHYERFTGVNAKKGDSTTAGKIYQTLLNKERRGDYLGKTVQVIPHITDLIKEFIVADTKDCDFVLCEIGGTVGDIEAQPFCEAIRQLRNELGSKRCLFLHLTLVPYIKASKEIKTKPTQHSVKEMRSIGIQPDILLCRSEKEIPLEDRQKISLFCNVPVENVIPALDQKSIYQVLIEYHNEGLDDRVLKHFNLKFKKPVDVKVWQQIIKREENPTKEVTIAVVGKYNNLEDSYKSLVEALKHGGIANNARVNIRWVNSVNIKEDNIAAKLGDVCGILVPGGFGARGVEGKILAIKYAREKNIPFFGICLGMQLACIEFARNVMKISDANSSEFAHKCTTVIGLMTEWMSKDELQKRSKKGDLGGTMRLGAFDCDIKKDTLAYKIYKSSQISERHRHRYEFNSNFIEKFKKAGFEFSGTSEKNRLIEIIEYPKNDFFIAVQFHPELKSRPFEPHPIFTSFIKQAIGNCKR